MKNALVIIDRDFTRKCGSRLRTTAIAHTLRTLGFRTSFLVPEDISVEAIALDTDPVFRVKVQHFAGGNPIDYDRKPYVSGLALACSQTNPDVVIAEYLWMAPLLWQTPAACIRVVDTHDVFHPRLTSYIEAGLEPWIRCSRQEEASLLTSADVLIAIQHLEADLLKGMLPRHQVGVVPHFQHQLGGYRRSSGSRLLFVGDNHSGNLGIIRFIAEVLPKIRSQVPQAELRICGDIVCRLRAAPGVTMLGIVDDLASEYRDAAVVVCPIDHGTGLKIKVVEALSVGRATVGTRTAFLGLPDPNPSAWKEADSPADQAKAILKLLRDDDARWDMENSARNYVSTYFSKENAQAGLETILEKGRLRRDERVRNAGVAHERASG